MISEKNDLSFMLIDRKKMGNTVILQEAFERIRDEYIDTFGIGENYKNILDLKKDIVCLRIDMAISGDGFIQNFIDMAQMDMNNFLNASEKTKHSEITVRLSKYMGYHVNERLMSVREYNEAVEVMRIDLTRKAA
jgi:hypothetical protein